MRLTAISTGKASFPEWQGKQFVIESIFGRCSSGRCGSSSSNCGSHSRGQGGPIGSSSFSGRSNGTIWSVIAAFSQVQRRLPAHFFWCLAIFGRDSCPRRKSNERRSLRRCSNSSSGGCTRIHSGRSR